MYCPLCGSPLKLIPKKKVEQIDWWDLPEKEMTNALAKLNRVENCKRDEYLCTKGCFQKDFPLYHHQPFQGIESAPGDSWSLSWIK